MKKRFAICSTIVLLLLLSACGAPQTLDFSYAPEGEELSSLMVETSQTHRAELEHVPSAADFADAISDDPASAGLLSESEVESLLRGHAAMETVSKEQAQSDVSLLFRTLQSCALFLFPDRFLLARTMHCQTGTGRNQLTDNNVLLESEESVTLASDRRVSKSLCGLLE